METPKEYLNELPLEEAVQLVYQSTLHLRFCELFSDRSDLWNELPHSHPCLELLYYVNGKVKVTRSNEADTFTFCDALLHPAHKSHKDEYGVDLPKEVICIWIESPGLVFEKSIYLHEQNNLLKYAFEQVYREAKRENPDRQYLEYAMKILLVTILRVQNQSIIGEKILDRTLEYLKNHFSERITLEALAAMEHISASYLSRKFKQRTGVTVVTYINQLRMERAQQLLMASTLNIDEIAYQTGFESPKYFYRVFKSITGESPANFRKKYSHSIQNEKSSFDTINQIVCSPEDSADAHRE